MSDTRQAGLGQAWLRSRVMTQGLCTGCGACVNLCPYQKIHRDATVCLHTCDREDGRCRAYCPRSPADLDRLRNGLFDAGDFVPELGPVKGLYLTRAADPGLRSAAQHGGTVSALMKVALETGIIDTALLAGSGDAHLPVCHEVTSAGDVALAAGSKFVVSPTVAAFNRSSAEGSARRIGVVATPCQALALAKMRATPWPQDTQRTRKLSLVVGLFCGWALDWKKLRALLSEKIGNTPVRGMDIPPSRHACMTVFTDAGTVAIPIETVAETHRDACNYCFDMTCEFSDLSVGSARSRDGWDVDRGWNQVIVRSRAGQELLNAARERGVLEFKGVPPENLANLKNASAKKKRACLGHLTRKTGTAEDLVYLDCEDAVVCRIKDR